MAKDRGGRDRRGKDRRRKHRAGKLWAGRRVDPATPRVGLAPSAPGDVSLDERLRETVSAGPLGSDPLSAGSLGAARTAPPADVPPVGVTPPPPTEPDRVHEALRAALAASTATKPRTMPEPAPTGHPAMAAIGATLVAYVQDESFAALSHLQALGAARSPAEAIRLQFDEMRRAADATLTCWSRLARDAGRLMEVR